MLCASHALARIKIQIHNVQHLAMIVHMFVRLILLRLHELYIVCMNSSYIQTKENGERIQFKGFWLTIG